MHGNRKVDDPPPSQINITSIEHLAFTMNLPLTNEQAQFATRYAGRRLTVQEATAIRNDVLRYVFIQRQQQQQREQAQRRQPDNHGPGDNGVQLQQMLPNGQGVQQQQQQNVMTRREPPSENRRQEVPPQQHSMIAGRYRMSPGKPQNGGLPQRMMHEFPPQHLQGVQREMPIPQMTGQQMISAQHPMFPQGQQMFLQRPQNGMLQSMFHGVPTQQLHLQEMQEGALTPQKAMHQMILPQYQQQINQGNQMSLHGLPNGMPLPPMVPPQENLQQKRSKGGQRTKKKQQTEPQTPHQQFQQRVPQQIPGHHGQHQMPPFQNKFPFEMQFHPNQTHPHFTHHMAFQEQQRREAEIHLALQRHQNEQQRFNRQQHPQQQRNEPQRPNQMPQDGHQPSQQLQFDLRNPLHFQILNQFAKKQMKQMGQMGALQSVRNEPSTSNHAPQLPQVSQQEAPRETTPEAVIEAVEPTPQFLLTPPTLAPPLLPLPPLAPEMEQTLKRTFESIQEIVRSFSDPNGKYYPCELIGAATCLLDCLSTCHHDENLEWRKNMGKMTPNELLERVRYLGNLCSDKFQRKINLFERAHRNMESNGNHEPTTKQIERTCEPNAQNALKSMKEVENNIQNYQVIPIALAGVENSKTTEMHSGRNPMFSIHQQKRVEDAPTSSNEQTSSRSATYFAQSGHSYEKYKKEFPAYVARLAQESTQPSESGKPIEQREPLEQPVEPVGQVEPMKEAERQTEEEEDEFNGDHYDVAFNQTCEEEISRPPSIIDPKPYREHITNESVRCVKETGKTENLTERIEPEKLNQSFDNIRIFEQEETSSQSIQPVQESSRKRDLIGTSITVLEDGDSPSKRTRTQNSEDDLPRRDFSPVPEDRVDSHEPAPVEDNVHKRLRSNSEILFGKTAGKNHTAQEKAALKAQKAQNENPPKRRAPDSSTASLSPSTSQSLQSASQNHQSVNVSLQTQGDAQPPIGSLQKENQGPSTSQPTTSSSKKESPHKVITDMFQRKTVNRNAPANEPQGLAVLKALFRQQLLMRPKHLHAKWIQIFEQMIRRFDQSNPNRPTTSLELVKQMRQLSKDGKI